MARYARVILLLGVLPLIYAQRVGVPTEDLTSLNVEDLFQVQVTSVGRKAQQLSKAPAAVYVLTAEDIRRSGATSIPEALQWVPGLTVLSVDGRAWAVSARGSTRLYADKMLVMVDGRSLYTRLFSGVMWEFINIPLENIEQIEVIRGPGSVMWGPNAVNGVVNIITRKAKDKPGVEVTTSAGTDLRGSGLVSWSAAFGERLAIRLWSKVEDRNPAYSSLGSYMFDGVHQLGASTPVASLDSRTVAAGVRVDYQFSPKDELMVQADVVAGGREEVLAYAMTPGVLDEALGHTGSEGRSVQLRWTRTPSAGNESTLQFTLDKQTTDFPFIDIHLNNMAIDYQYRHQTGETNEVYLSTGYQQYWDSTFSRRFVGFEPGSAIYRLTHMVIRDEWQPIPGKVLLSMGARLDYSLETRLELQPTARLLFTPSTRQSAWFAVSRAARMPNRFDRALHTDAGQEVVAGFLLKTDIYGSPDIRSETEYSAEAGYRYQSRQRWSLDTAAFWSRYPRIRLLKFPLAPEIVFAEGVPVRGSVAGRQESSGTGRTFGLETSMILQVKPGWRMIPSWSYLNERLWTPPPTALVAYAQMFSSSAPKHQALLRSQHTIARYWQIDWMIRGRSRNEQLQLPAGIRSDVRMAWRPGSNWELSATVRNLTGHKDLEAFSEGPFVAIPVRRSLVFRSTLRF